MSVDTVFTGFAPHTVTITPTTTRNNYGEVSAAGTARTAKAYVDPLVQFNQSDQTNESHHPITVFILDTSIVITDKITLPDGTTPKITAVAIYDSIAGLEHAMVRFA